MDDAALCRGGFALAYFAGELDFGAECTRRGLAMNPNFAAGWSYSAWVLQWLGEHRTALEHVRHWERLSPRDPSIFQGKLIAAYSRSGASCGTNR